MPYDQTADPHAYSTPGIHGFGRIGAPVTPSDGTDLARYARIVLLETGNVSVLPVKNADGVPIAFTGLPAGYVVPFFVRRVLATGTNADVATIELDP